MTTTTYKVTLGYPDGSSKYYECESDSPRTKFLKDTTELCFELGAVCGYAVEKPGDQVHIFGKSGDVMRAFINEHLEAK